MFGRPGWVQRIVLGVVAATAAHRAGVPAVDGSGPDYRHRGAHGD